MHASKSKHTIWYTIGLDCQDNSYHMYGLWLAVHALTVVLEVAVGNAVLSAVGLGFTLLHELGLFVGLVFFTLDLAHEGVAVFGRFGLLRAIASFFVVLVCAIFFLQRTFDGAAFEMPADSAPTHTMGDRLNLFVTAVYGASVVLSGAGNTSILPVTWYSRLIFLPHLAFSFLINVVVFGAFVKAISRTNSPLV